MPVAQRMIESHPNYSFDINYYSKVHDDIGEYLKKTMVWEKS